MTIQEALDLADQMKPNMLPKAVKIRFLNEVEQMIHGEIVLKHVHTPEEGRKPSYETETDPGTEMIMPSPYDMLYVYWLMSRIDHVNMEMDKYNNDRALFENAYMQAGDWWNRTRMPIQATREIRI